MKIPMLLAVLLSIFWSSRAGAQSINDGNFFTGVQLVNLATGGKARQPMMYVWEDERIKIDQRVSIGMDITLAKNTVPYSRVQGKVLEFFHLAVPVHLDFRASGNCFVEAGVYISAVTRSRNVYLTEFVQIKYFEQMELRMDAGLMGGVSVDLKKWGKMHLRYNHGLFPAVPISGERIVKDRMVSTGMTFSF